MNTPATDLDQAALDRLAEALARLAARVWREHQERRGSPRQEDDR